ncbi:MAG: hypothetical protein DDT26_00182 [Dehalococcoidia bacterium]|nr:hypothetical protein [Chloroflexota bacterium]
MSTHQFDVDDAVRYGVEAAIMLQNIRFWIAKNKANKRHFYDGRYWTYNSARAFTELFPYWSQPQIRRVLAKLIDAGVLVVGEYNQNPYDHTRWYALSDDVDLTKSEDRENEVGKSSIRTDNKPDTRENPPPPKGAGEFEAFWKKYPKKVAKGAAEKSFKKIKPSEDLMKTIMQALERQKESDQWKDQGGRYIPNPATWLNQRRWEDEETEAEERSSMFAGLI